MEVVNVNQALLDRFAGFTGLTYDEWAALEDSEDKWLFYLLCYNRYFLNAVSYADYKSNRENMMDALNYLGINTTTIPDGVVIDGTSCYAIPGTLWMSNPELHGGIVGVTAENADMVINKLANAIIDQLLLNDDKNISKYHTATYSALKAFLSFPKGFAQCAIKTLIWSLASAQFVNFKFFESYASFWFGKLIEIMLSRHISVNGAA